MGLAGLSWACSCMCGQLAGWPEADGFRMISGGTWACPTHWLILQKTLRTCSHDGGRAREEEADKGPEALAWN